MKKKILAFFTAVVLATSLAACGSGGGGASPAANGASPAGAGNDELVVGLVKVPSNMDPYNSYGDDAYGHMQIYDTLLVKDENGKIAPSVAESWEVSPDGLTYTLKIRQGVQLSDGTDFTAEDAKFNIDKGVESGYTNWAMAGVADSKALDASTLEITLKNADISFPEKLTWIYLVGKKSYEAAGAKYGLGVDTIAGTGPYILKEWRPGESASFEANPNYFAGEAAIKKVLFKTMSDANAAMIALQTGEISLYIKDVPAISFDALSANQEITVSSYPSYVFMNVLMNCGDGLFADPAVREAVALAVDRDKMLLVGTEGQGQIVDYPGGPDYIGNPNIQLFPTMDQEKAKQIIANKGLAGTKIQIKTMDSDPWPKLATALQDDLNKIGFDAGVLLLDYAGYSMEIWQNLNYEIAIGRYWSGTKDMSEVMDLLKTDAGMNYSAYSNTAIDPILTKAAGAATEEERAKLYEEAIRAFTPEYPMVPLFYTNGSRAYSSKLAIAEGNVQYDRMYYYSWK